MWVQLLCQLSGQIKIILATNTRMIPPWTIKNATPGLFLPGPFSIGGTQCENKIIPSLLMKRGRETFFYRNPKNKDMLKKDMM